jgi:hypothetical protein
MIVLLSDCECFNLFHSEVRLTAKISDGKTAARQSTQEKRALESASRRRGDSRGFAASALRGGPFILQRACAIPRTSFHSSV